MTAPQRGKPVSKILLADPDRESRLQLRRLLDHGNAYEFVEAATGADTLAAVRDHNPDLILMDVALPDQDGFDLCLLLRADERTRTIPILVVTALDKPEDKIKAFKMGANDYLVKPTGQVETNARVEAQLRMKRYQDRQKELLTELKRTQDVLMQASKLSAAGTLAAGVAHEFNNILQILDAHAALCSQSRDEADVTEMIRVVREVSSRGGRIAQGLLDFARRDELQNKQPADLKELVERNLDLMRGGCRKFGVEIARKFEDGLPKVECYPGQLSQVLVNLVQNSIDAMHRSEVRRLTVEVRRCACRGAACGADPLGEQERKKGCIQIVVSDTGKGVAASVREKIFEPFVTTKGVLGGGSDSTPGTGLGLSVSYGIVRRHGGFIRFVSEEGQGAEFTVSLPL